MGNPIFLEAFPFSTVLEIKQPDWMCPAEHLDYICKQHMQRQRLPKA